MTACRSWIVIKMKAVLTSSIFLLAFLGSRSETLVKKVLLDKSGESALVGTIARHDDGQEEIRNCELITKSDEVQAVLQSTPYSDVKQATNEEIQEAIDDCAANKRPVGDQGTQGRPEGSVSNITEGGSGVLILPGTNWCGAGHRAKEIQDLGFNEDTDQCCRAHDLCDDNLASGETRNNLTNDSSFTKLNCQCDQEFYECLEKVDSVVSNTVGRLYFNVLGRECYTYDHPYTVCKTHKIFLRAMCKEYEKDTSAPKVWQWVAPRRYTRVPVLLPPGTLRIDVDYLLKLDKLKSLGVL